MCFRIILCYDLYNDVPQEEAEKKAMAEKIESMEFDVESRNKGIHNFQLQLTEELCNNLQKTEVLNCTICHLRMPCCYLVNQVISIQLGMFFMLLSMVILKGVQ
ncbi:uncharacterized protein LOC135148553 isoform X1 [Daucus carota subsp. sativus]|uniref:uncharacterized protein LOC135148553 isoform X1 n=1 Tax=Daucus carota subsp. sativus TaxID=79200 RepID=UPI003083CCE6